MKYLLMFVICLAAVAQAMTINDTVINLTTTHTLINVTYPWTMDSLQINTNSFTVWNLESSHPNQTGTYLFTFNYSSAQNLTGYQMPYVSTYSSNQIIITYGGTNALNISIYGCLPYAPQTVTYHSGLGNYTTFSGTSWSSTTLCGNLSVLTLETGSNQINITYASSSHGVHVEGICNQMYLLYGIIGLIVIVLIGAGILAVLNAELALPIVVTAITAIVTIILGFIILAEVCI